jgi:signal peptidase II
VTAPPLPVAFYVIAATALGVDQLVKWLVVTSLAVGARVVVIPHLLTLTHARNPGAAFGLLPTATVGLIVAGVVIIGMLLLYGRRVAACRPLWIGLALQIGGALGNLIDRIFRGPELFHGRVVDFIDVHLTRTYTWPTFNVADICITVGAALIAYCLLTGKAEGEAREPAEPQPEPPSA